jgi:HK97 family phage portal protein
MKILGLEFPSRRDARIELAPEQRASPENPKFSLSDPAILDALGIGDDLTTNVSPSGALQSSAVFSCVKVLAESIGQLPIRMYRRNGDSRDLVTDHPVSDLIGLSPNPIMTRVTWFEQQMTQLATWGNCYAQRIFDRRTDRTIALYPLASSDVKPRVTPGKDAEGFPCLVKTYHVRGDVLADEDVLHIPLMSLNGFEGLSPIAMNRMGVSMNLSQQKFAATFYQNGTKLSGALETANKLSKEAAARLRENWTSVYQGAANSGKVAILEEGLKFNPLSMPLEDAQFIETMKFSREQIAGIFRVPPHMIASLDRATFSNIEQQSLEFAVYTLGPYLVKWEQSLARTLLTATEQRSLYFKFNLDALLRGDIKSRYEAYAIARQWGWLSADDILETEDRNALPDKQGKVYLQPMNMVPAGTPPAMYLKGAQQSGPGANDNGT